MPTPLWLVVAVIIMKKKPTIRQQINQLKKKKAAFDAHLAKMKADGDAPLAQLKKQKADFDAHIQALKHQAEAPAVEAEKRRAKEDARRVEDNKRRIKADEAARVPMARAKREHEALISHPRRRS